MALREEMEQQGNWLFKWRSYLPIAALPVLALALRQPGYFDQCCGYTASQLWKAFSFLVVMLGLGVRAVTAGFVPRGTSGRNTQSQVAETLNTTGMYSVVRNPLYLGNFLMVLGVILSLQVWWLASLFVLGFWIYYERIIFAEEEFLRKKFGVAYVQWAQRTPVFIPKFGNWQKPAMLFSFKTVLRREFTSFFGGVCAFIGTGVIHGLLSKGRLEIEPAWLALFIFSVLVYFVLLVLKKKTKLLNVQGR